MTSGAGSCRVRLTLEIDVSGPAAASDMDAETFVHEMFADPDRAVGSFPWDEMVTDVEIIR